MTTSTEAPRRAGRRSRWIRRGAPPGSHRPLGAAKRLLLAAALGVGGWLAVVPESAGAGQRRLPRVEDRMLRDASAQEARGELAGAEETLRELLRRRPNASSAVLALERVLRSAGRLAAVLPVADAFLAADPSSGAVWSLKLRALVEGDSLAALEETSSAWARAVPGSPAPYREGARAYLEAGKAEEAAALIEDGLRALGSPPELWVALGDVHVSAGRLDAGAEAWAQALGRDRARTGDVLRRLEELGDGPGEGAPGDRARAAGALVAALGAPTATASQLEVGAEVALREGLEDDARTMAETALEGFGDREGRGYLRGFARRAEELNRPGSALWAYSRLGETARDEAERRATDERMASVALAAGDTAAALGALSRVTASHPPGSDAWRAAWTAELVLRVAAADVREVREALARYRDEFPDAEELDRLSAALASRLMRSADVAGAMEVLAGIDGPGAALERAFLLLEGGAIAEGAAALQESLPELEPARATEALALALTLDRLTPVGALVVARAAVAVHRGAPAEAVGAVQAGAEAVPEADRPAVLAMGARTAAAAGLDRAATAFRRAIVADHADAPEFAEAALELARGLAVRPEGGEEAARILEELIVAHPESPVVPGARRELERLRGGRT